MMQDETPRVRIETLEVSDALDFKIKRQNISIVNAIEVLKRVEWFFMGLKPEEIDEFKYFDSAPGETKSLCIAWNPDTRQIRMAATGLNAWDCSIMARASVQLLYKDLEL